MLQSHINYVRHKYTVEGIRKCFDTTIYTFDIETTSYIKLDGKIYPAIEYLNFDKEEQERVEFFSTMYIWQFGINDTIYYGRTWEELKDFLNRLQKVSPFKKYVFVHNLSFEFQYLQGVFDFKNVMARVPHKPMTAEMCDYNIVFRCTYFMTGTKLEYLPKLYGLTTEKLTGDLDYSKIRHSESEMTAEELAYCENDCLIVFEYIQKELEIYGHLNKLPLTNTGKVRKELHTLTDTNYNYRNKVRKSINIDPHVYNLLIGAFARTVTHTQIGLKLTKYCKMLKAGILLAHTLM